MNYYGFIGKRIIIENFQLFRSPRPRFPRFFVRSIQKRLPTESYTTSLQDTNSRPTALSGELKPSRYIKVSSAHFPVLCSVQSSSEELLHEAHSVFGSKLVLSTGCRLALVVCGHNMNE
jgi:hypothetical protein